MRVVYEEREHELLAAHMTRWIGEHWTAPGYVTMEDWSRGFVSVVRAPLAAIMEHGPALVREHPGCVMEVTDREPDHIGNEVCWVLYREDLTDQALLPKEIFDRLEGGQRESGGEDWERMFGFQDRWAIYPSYSLALAALDDAVTAWCRERAEE